MAETNPTITKAPPRAKLKRRKLIPWIIRPGNTILVFFQELLNRIFIPSMNPMYYLGAITFFLFWIVLGSGIYLLLFYDMNPLKAYDSVQYLIEEQKYYGGIMRSLHRYASDGLIIIIVLHILQVFFSDRFRHYRWVAWITGMIILPPLWLDGITGYFLVWDEKGQMIAQTLATFVDWLPILSQPVSRNFIYNDSIKHTLFFVITFIHITIPSMLMILAWVHCMRISKPLINPPKAVAHTIASFLVLVSLLKPALSDGPADLSKLAGKLDIDWFYMFIFPAMDFFHLTTGWIWIFFIAGGALLSAMPWIIRDPKKPEKAETPEMEEKPEKSLVIPMAVPKVELSKCVGCNLCVEACPFLAISIIPRTDGRPYETEVKILSDRCAQSGFCVAACPFDGLAIGEFSDTSIGKRIKSILAAEAEEVKPVIVTFVCERALDITTILSEDMSRFADNPEVAATIIPCIGFVSPKMIEETFAAGAQGIAIVSCRSLDCHYREGRRRVKGKFDTDQSLFPIEEMELENVKIFQVSRFAMAKLEEDVEEFLEEIKSQDKADKRQ